MSKYVYRAIAWSFAISFTIITTMSLFFLVGPSLETRILPVISNVQATPITIDPERQVIHIAAFGQKTRQCEWKGITAMVEKSGVWHQGNVFFSDPRANAKPNAKIPTSRPVGSQSLGEIYVMPAGDKVQVHLYHQCHPFWQTHTFLYELDFSQKPNQTR